MQHSKLRVRYGQIIGRNHMQRQQNCQDGLTVIETESLAVGVICDGCGSGSRSEVGAILASSFLAQEAAKALENSTPLSELAVYLYDSLRAMLSQFIAVMQPDDVSAFVQEHLLFTVLGFALHKETEVALIWAAGDGWILTDDQFQHRDQQNTPEYPAYALLPHSSLRRLHTELAFEVIEVPHNWKRFAIASDGLEDTAIPLIWGQTHPRGLQRTLNRLSLNEHRLHDDTSVVVVEREISVSSRE